MKTEQALQTVSLILIASMLLSACGTADANGTATPLPSSTPTTLPTETPDPSPTPKPEVDCATIDAGSNVILTVEQALKESASKYTIRDISKWSVGVSITHAKSRETVMSTVEVLSKGQADPKLNSVLPGDMVCISPSEDGIRFKLPLPTLPPGGNIFNYSNRLGSVLPKSDRIMMGIQRGFSASKGSKMAPVKR